MTTPEPIVIVDGARTPVGSFGGVFKDVPAHELGAAAAKAALSRAGVAPEDIDEVVMGCIGQVGAEARVAGAAARDLDLAAGQQAGERESVEVFADVFEFLAGERPLRRVADEGIVHALGHGKPSFVA